jgi:glycosyltransferase involved in cell wall biosynthesis
MPLRITLISPFDPQPAAVQAGSAHVGGVERVFAEVARRLAARGHDVTLICSTMDRPGRSREAGMTVIRRTCRLTILRAPVCRLSRHIPRNSDVVQVAATYPFTTASCLRRAKELGIPAVLDFHFEPSPPGVIGHLAAQAYLRVGPPAYRLADAVLVRSQAYARSAPALAAVDPSRLRVVANGIDPARFNTMGPRRPGDYLLFVGRLVPYKGLEVLLEALAGPGGVPLVVVGDGPLRKRLEARAKELGVDALFLGRVADEDLPALYRGARLTVLPSVNGQEAFGITLLESMACGTPVVASDLPGVGDVARLGGLTARPGDAQDLARVLEAALQEGAVPRGEALAKAIHAAYSWDAITDRVLAVHEELVAQRRAQEVTPVAHPGRGAVLRS